MEAENANTEAEAGLQAVFVRSVASDDFLTMVLHHTSRCFNFKRPKAEPCERLCTRIATNLRGAKGKKKKKKRTAEEMDCGSDEAVPVGILDASGAAVAGDVSSEQALQAGGVVKIGGCRYKVLRNAPGVSRLRLPDRPLVGCPAFAEVCTEFCDLPACGVEWFLHPPQPEAPPVDAPGWTPALRAPSFVAEPHQVDHWVKVTASPPGGLPRSEITKGPIQAGPTARSPIKQRHQLMEAPCAGNTFRLVCYNLLADLYADSDHSRNQLFPYCPAHFLAQGYRRQVILWELQNYNADLMCLQEVDRDFFEAGLRPFFAADFGAAFMQKGDNTREGVAVLYRLSRFQLLSDNASLECISKALPTIGLLEEKDGSLDISKSEKFSSKWADRNQCLLALHLRCVNTGQRVLVATTHLFFHPVADNVRLLQAALCFSHLEAAMSEGEALLFAGDFNSDPRNGVFELACEGRTRATQSDWYSAGRDEFFGCPLVRHGLRLQSAYDPFQLQFTNYTAGFRGVLDYIFFQPHRLSLQRTIPLPPKEDVVLGIALPNELFPSDHLALIAEFSF